MLRASGLAEETDLGDFGGEGHLPFSHYRGVRWVGGNATLVQTGDIVDRGDHARDIYALFAELRRVAPLAGGRVINLVGNHELLNLKGDLRYVSPGDVEAFGGAARRQEAFNVTGEIGRQIVEDFQAIAVLGDTAFAHAGIMPQDAERGAEALNEVARKALKSAAAQGRGKRRRDDASEEGRLLGATGPFWLRRFARGAEGETCAVLAETLRLLGARRLVVGHTQVDEGNVRPRCGGRLLMADTIISKNGYPECWDPALQAREGCWASMSYVEIRGPAAFAVRVVEEPGEAAAARFRLEESPLPSTTAPGSGGGEVGTEGGQEAWLVWDGLRSFWERLSGFAVDSWNIGRKEL